jgi:hypothetical protein
MSSLFRQLLLRRAPANGISSRASAGLAHCLLSASAGLGSAEPVRSGTERQLLWKPLSFSYWSFVAWESLSVLVYGSSRPVARDEFLGSRVKRLMPVTLR